MGPHPATSAPRRDQRRPWVRTLAPPPLSNGRDPAGACLALALPLLLGLGLGLGLALGLAPTAGAGSVYKAVDAEGRVTYSAKPPAADGQHVEQIKVPGGPDDALAEPDPGGQARQQARAKAISAAQQQVIRAKAALEQAKIQSPEDWQTQPGSGRVLSAAYFNRVTAAEGEVETAERALEEARKQP
jgi:hypothetical protein